MYFNFYFNKKCFLVIFNTNKLLLKAFFSDYRKYL